jgi:hypothetical protein
MGAAENRFLARFKSRMFLHRIRRGDIAGGTKGGGKRATLSGVAQNGASCCSRMRMRVQVYLRLVVAISTLLVGLWSLDGVVGQDRRLDRFNYDTTKIYSNRFDFGPEEWIKVRCEGQDKSNCVRCLHGL